MSTNTPRDHAPGIHHSPAWFKPFRLSGLVLFLIGLAVFTGSLFLDDYQLTRSGLEQVSDQVPADIRDRLDPLLGRTFDSKFTLLDAIDRHINPDGSLQPYQLETYRFWILKAGLSGLLAERTLLLFLMSFGLGVLGALLYMLPALHQLPGIKNNHLFQRSLTARGLIGILLGSYLIGFYVLLYWFPEYVVNAVKLVDPVSEAFRNRAADRWFLYGILYTLAVAVMGVRMAIKYRHSRYHLIRTASVIFFQTAFAFAIPTILERFNRPSMDLKNAWPLNYTFFMDWNLNSLIESGMLGWFMLVWGIVLSLVLVPLFSFLWGKRWYCSWVCGCGGLAETLGDPFRQLSDKSLGAWKIERWMIHGVLVFAVVMTGMQVSNFLSDGGLFGNYTWRVNQAYSFFIGAAFAGVVGTGFYPLMGNRVWCRFGCPLAAILGAVQKFKSRFVITTNGGQCISCGNCSTYCEMGIDVRWYAQRGQNIIRSSCVGCGVCAAVCPRGVLRLELTDPGKRYNVVLDDELVAAMERGEGQVDVRKYSTTTMGAE